MTRAHRRYLQVETAVSAGINAVLSIAFALLLFGGQLVVATPALVRDALPQSFAIALMASLVPLLLLRQRVRTRAITTSSGRAIAGPVVRSLLTALGVAAIAGAVHWVLLPRLLPDGAPFGAMLAGKAVYGATLGACVTLVALRRALRG